MLGVLHRARPERLREDDDDYGLPDHEHPSPTLDGLTGKEMAKKKVSQSSISLSPTFGFKSSVRMSHGLIYEQLQVLESELAMADKEEIQYLIAVLSEIVDQAQDSLHRAKVALTYRKA